MPLEAPVTSTVFRSSPPTASPPSGRRAAVSSRPVPPEFRNIGGTHSLTREPRVRLLVSVRSAAEAGTALEGGADIVDAKEPARGPLGAVDPVTIAEILAVLPDT